MIKHIIPAEKFDLPSRFRSYSRSRFLLKGLLPIITLSLFLTCYIFSFSTTSSSDDISITPSPDISTKSSSSDIFTTSSPNISTTLSLSLSPSPSVVSTIPKNDEITFDNEEKYLTYLPHSGFHNQRVSFMNALMLSYLTNRTLIIPPILVYRYPYNDPVYELYDKINEIIKIKKYRKDHCKNNSMDDNEKNSTFCKEEYSKDDKFTMINVDQVFDFSEIKKHVRTVNRGYEITLDSLLRNFNFSQNDTRFFIENSEVHRYDIRIYDTDNSTEPLYDYGTKLLLSDLLKIDKKLLHFGSLFNPTYKKPTNDSKLFYNPYRIVLDRKENVKFHRFIRDNLMINNSKVLNVSDRIIHELGREGSYSGLHIRVGDEWYLSNKSITTNEKYDSLMKELQKMNIKIRRKKKFFSYNLKNCLKNNLTIVFISTDSNNPRKDFKIFYRNIPCVFTLFDFEKELKILDNSFSDYDKNIDLKNFYTSLVDLLTAAYGKIFIGTERSTFSDMAYEIHRLHINNRNK